MSKKDEGGTQNNEILGTIDPAGKQNEKVIK